MGRYYFHIAGRNPHRDEIGEDLKDDIAAWQEAVRLTRDIEHAFDPGHIWRLEVHDERKPVYRLEIISHIPGSVGARRSRSRHQ